MTYINPEFKLDAFHCPLCGTYAHMQWDGLEVQDIRGTDYHEAMCSRCNKPSLWRVTKTQGIGIGNAKTGRFDLIAKAAELVYPDNGVAPLPVEDMPNDVKAEYIEAARIFSRSPRGAAALLRLGLQKLCKHLGQDGKHIDTDIRGLASQNVVPPLVVKVADTVRITGNNAIHPGEMSDDDFDQVASKMFDLLNFIVKKGISEPKELEALYTLTPENPRKDAEGRDAKAREKNT